MGSLATLTTGLALGFALALLTGLGCDERQPQPRSQPAAEAAPAASTPKSPPATAETSSAGLDEAIPVTLPGPTTRRGRPNTEAIDPAVPSPEPGESLADCLARCSSTQLSQDNRATCRLLCDSHHGPKPTAQADALLGGFFGCFDQCESHSCETGCAKQVGKTSCSARCLETLASCLPACSTSDAEGRCSERCETSARRCLGKC